jgi:hypothetical protein
VRVRAAGAGRFEGEALHALRERAHARDHQAASRDGGCFGVEGRKAARDFVRVDELADFQLLGQEDLGGRRLACAVRAAEDDDVLHLPIVSSGAGLV